MGQGDCGLSASATCRGTPQPSTVTSAAGGCTSYTARDSRPVVLIIGFLYTLQTTTSAGTWTRLTGVSGPSAMAGRFSLGGPSSTRTDAYRRSRLLFMPAGFST